MINLRNLIDFLPFEFKDKDTYKVDDKGILERFLEICGEHFEDYITKDISNVLDIIDIDKTPEHYLNYLWEFLGQMPFAYGNSINAEKWKQYYNGFDSDEKIKELSKLWIIPKEGPFSLSTEQVRTILKYSISLFKIRGTTRFFDIIFKMYGLTCTVTDPAKSDDYDGWIMSHPFFDQEDYLYDDKRTYDNTFNCSQCIPVTFKLSGHGYSSNTSEFKKFREAIESFFDRFKPYNVSANVDYGFVVNDNYKITVELENPDIKNLIISEVFEVPVIITVTSDWVNSDLRFQISGDKVNWGYTKHPSGTTFKITRAGTYYFRSVGDPTKITEITVGQESYNRVYRISCEPVAGRITPSNLRVTTIVRASLSYKGRTTQCRVRLSGTDEVKPSGAQWEFTDAGTYWFEIVDFPVKQTSFVVTKDPVTYKVTCTPSIVRIADGQTMKDAKTTLTITSNYPITEPLYCRLIGDQRLYKSGDIYKANNYGTFKFKCTLDTSDKEDGVGIFEVTSNKTSIYRVSIDPNNATLYDGLAKTTVKIVKISGSGNDYRVRVVETGDVFDAKNGYVYTTNKAGTYTFQCEAYPSAKVYWTVNNPPEVFNNKLSIVPNDPSDINWLTPDWNLPEDQLDDTYAKYRLVDITSKCTFKLEGVLNGIGINGDVRCIKDGDESNMTTYEIGKNITLTSPGSYEFRYAEDSALSCTVDILDFDTQIQVKCDPEKANLGGLIKSVSTRVTCVSNKADFDSRVRLVGSVNLLDTPYDFTTSTAGTYIFESIIDTSVRATFIVSDDDVLSVSPEIITWESGETDEKELSINTFNTATWKILK